MEAKDGVGEVPGKGLLRCVTAVVVALACPPIVDAASHEEKVAFAGIDTLGLRVRIDSDLQKVIPESRIRTRTEWILRSSGVPLAAYGQGTGQGSVVLQILVTAVPVQGPSGRAGWAFSCVAQLRERVLVLRRDEKTGIPAAARSRSRILVATTWSRGSIVVAPTREVEASVLEAVAEYVEEAGNLYLATHGRPSHWEGR